MSAIDFAASIRVWRPASLFTPNAIAACNLTTLARYRRAKARPSSIPSLAVADNGGSTESGLPRFISSRSFGMINSTGHRRNLGSNVLRLRRQHVCSLTYPHDCLRYISVDRVSLRPVPLTLGGKAHKHALAAFEGLGDMEGRQTAPRNALAALPRFLECQAWLLVGRWLLMTRSTAVGSSGGVGEIAHAVAVPWPYREPLRALKPYPKNLLEYYFYN